jgi:hypothetical protein
MISLQRLASVAVGALLTVTVVAAPAQAWWPSGSMYEECKFGEGFHCYSLSQHSVKALESIVYIKDLWADIPEWETDAFSTHEQWIEFGNTNEWVETGDISGYEFSCCSPHPFYAEDKEGVFKIELSPGTVPDGYNHYTLADTSLNGVWRVYWNCCEVGSEAGWPEKFSKQEAGVEVDSETEPASLERQLVAWAQGGEWFPWTGDNWSTESGLCVKANPESEAAGNIQAGTKLGATEAGASC